MLARRNPSFLLIALTIVLASQARATIMPADAGCSQSLNGVWRFKLEQALPDVNARSVDWRAVQPIRTPRSFEPFHAPAYRENKGWHDLAVPSNWEMAGFSPATYNEPDNASGFYRKWFVVPARWKGRLVKINFDGVQNAAEVWLNGHLVKVSEPSWGRSNYHESGWTAWQADLTPYVQFGRRNLLALRVTKNTESSNLDTGDYFFLGGIHRPVTLFSVPRAHVEDLTVRTYLIGRSKARVSIAVLTAGSPGIAGTVSARLKDGPTRESRVDRSGLTSLSLVVPRPHLWSAEHPNLYSLAVALKDSKGRVVESITRRIGIREISIRKGVLLVNGVPVKLTGVCRHDVYPSKGTALDESVWRKDLTLMKRANINAVRTSHYPYGARFYDLCDQMGFYVLGELPFCWCDTNKKELLPAFLQRAREAVARDKNHPCIIIWGIGNENKSGPSLQSTADLVKRLDPTRPRLVSCKKADEYGVEMDDSHYTPLAGIAATALDTARRAKWPQIYSECPNVWDVRLGADYGCLDLWEEVLRRTWDEVWKSDGIMGAFLWEWQDRAVCDKFPTKLYEYDPATGVQYLKTKGVVDGWRHPRPEYFNVKMIYSPIEVDAVPDFDSKPGSLVLKVTNHYSFTDLSALNAKWTLLGRGGAIRSGVAHFRLAPRSRGKVELKLPAGWLSKIPEAIRIDFDHPGGWNVVSRQFSLVSVNPWRLTKALPDGLKFPSLNLVSNSTVGDKAKWRKITRYRGSLVNVRTDPAVQGDLSAEPLVRVQSMDADIVLNSDAKAVVGHVHADFADGKFSYRVDWTAGKSDIQELGWVFEMPHSFDHFSWDREALWSVYPQTHIGRPTGTALPDSANVHLTDISRPDAFDFNSTKYHCNWADLTNADGHGLRVEFAPDQRHQVRAGFGRGGAYQLIVNKQCSPPMDISSNTVEDLYMRLKPGDVIEGSFTIGSK